MTILYGFSYDGSGELDAYTVQDEKRAHFGDIGNYGGYPNKVPVEGDTYPIKENIKSTNWNKTKYDWTGDVWAIHIDGLRDVIEAVLERYDEVSVEVDTVHECGELSEFHDEIKTGPDSDDILSFERKPMGDKDGVPESWAKDAARLGNFDSVEEFAERFNFNVLPDEEFDNGSDGDDKDDGALPGSLDGMVTG